MIDLNSPYYSPAEQSLMRDFLAHGYVIFPVANAQIQDFMKHQICQLVTGYLGMSEHGSDLLDTIHHKISPAKLNDLRLHVIQNLSKNDEFKQHYFELGRETLYHLVSNELCMQRVCNLSIQMPHDKESLLPLHADTWSGNSPYEVVFWLPFTDCYRTKSMYILPVEQSRKIVQNFSKVVQLSSEELFKEIESELVWLNIPYGHGLVFSHTLLHGNRVNVEEGSRWSFNIRFKSMLTPYGDKALAETFVPITMKPLTQLGFQYEAPTV